MIYRTNEDVYICGGKVSICKNKRSIAFCSKILCPSCKLRYASCAATIIGLKFARIDKDMSEYIRK